MNSLVNYVKPSVPKRYLMFVAALVWLFAGSMLFIKGFSFMLENFQYIVVKLLISFGLGSLFFAFMFSKIVAKHVARILNIKHEKPCLFSFFNWRSYLMMGSMIALGVLLRTFHLVPMVYLSCFYIAMGIPLLFSSWRFFREAVRSF
jgi:hypothetical protein